MTTTISRQKVRGIRFILDEDNQKKAVIIDLRRHMALWEDFYDTLLTKLRQSEPRETLEETRKRVIGKCIDGKI